MMNFINGFLSVILKERQFSLLNYLPRLGIIFQQCPINGRPKKSYLSVKEMCVSIQT